MNISNQRRLSAVVAMGENRVIGQNNRLPWHLPADLKHFKTITEGHPIIMGRKTYESIGRPLPNRINIILTHQTQFQAADCIVASTLEEALSQLSNLDQEIFIIGGAQIFQQFLPQITRIYLTIIHHEFAGDTFFSPLSNEEWVEKERKKYGADTQNPYDYSFLILDRVEGTEKRF